MKELFQQEAADPQVSSSLEQEITQYEHTGMEFCQNVIFMRQTLPEAAVPQPTLVQPMIVPISSQQA